MAYVSVLLAMFFLGTLYRDALFESSHAMIKKAQAGYTHDSMKVRVLDFLSEYTEDEHFVIFVLALAPFVSREKFWYYMISIWMTTFVKINTKMAQSEPRPTWVWSDMSSLGCSASFGSPSGHSARSANICFLIILDLFFASSWSRKKYPG